MSGERDRASGRGARADEPTPAFGPPRAPIGQADTRTPSRPERVRARPRCQRNAVPRVGRAIRSRIEDERLRGDVGLNVVGADERDHLAARVSSTASRPRCLVWTWTVALHGGVELAAAHSRAFRHLTSDRRSRVGWACAAVERRPEPENQRTGSCHFTRRVTGCGIGVDPRVSWR